MIDVEYRRSAAWAQLECHYGIVIMTHYRACRTPDLTGRTGAEPQFPIRPSAADPDNEQEQRQRVGEIYYAEGWRADWDPAFKARRTRQCQRCSPVLPCLSRILFFNHLL